ncbi:hypothetical protein HanXRQr2_Chr08g0347001 [Helianthus annuus]|uniref:Uncharacterized protein n=1 Tax=Helianthus annuus TaxID=4232 RepID=A0A9K3NE22_HELAN|nr:hypothetical protein HanXRQr2_Chr08g0347001 [Helianthus annuus]
MDATMAIKTTILKLKALISFIDCECDFYVDLFVVVWLHRNVKLNSRGFKS